MELKHYLAIMRRWGWLLVLAVVTTTAASYLWTSRQPRIYETQARFLVGPAIESPNVDSNALRASGQIGQIYAELAKSRPVAQGVVDKLQLDIDADTVSKSVSATWIESTQILTIRVWGSNPEQAARIANAFGDVLIERSPGGPTSLQASRQKEATDQIERLKAGIVTTQDEIAALSTQIQQATNDLTQRSLIVQLDQRRTQLETAQRALNDQYAIVQNNSANQIAVMEPAVTGWQIAPNIQQSLLMGVVAGLVIGLGLMLLIEYMHDVIHTPQDLRSATGVAYLGGVARLQKGQGARASQLVLLEHPETLAAETYRILRTNIQMPGGPRSSGALLVASPSRGDGKTEVAANLAIAFAQSGKRVILIDGNLRRPALAKLLKVEEQSALGTLLEETDKWPVPYAVPGVDRLWLLPAGPAVQNSSEILTSQRMFDLIQLFKRDADMVIIDSPPLLYSDALALAPQVDGVLLVAKSGVTNRQHTINAIESLKLVGANLLGVVLNRVKPGPAYDYYPLHGPKRATPAFANAGMVPEEALALHATAKFPTSDRLAEGAPVAEEGDGLVTEVLGSYGELFRRFNGTDGNGRDGSTDVV